MVLSSLGVVKDGATTKEMLAIWPQMKAGKHYYEIILSGMVAFQLRETKGLWFGYTKQKWNLLMRSKVSQQRWHVGRRNQFTLFSFYNKSDLDVAQ